jgi:mono-ADP-ribosyltransferase sirtuin 6
MRCGTPRSNLSEVHGNMFTSECPKCKRQFVRSDPVPTVGRKAVGVTCRNERRPCRGQLIDTILDWEDNLPDDDIEMAIMHSTLADLHIGLGSSFQIMPSGRFPLRSKKFGGKFVLVNLQPIKVEKKADLVIHSYVDEVLVKVLKRLGIEEIPEYCAEDDPTAKEDLSVSWNIPKKAMHEVEVKFKERTDKGKKGKRPGSGDEVVNKKKKKKKEESDDDDE